MTSGMTLSALYARFQQAVEGGDHKEEALGDIRPHPRLSGTEQLAIYRDGYRLRLVSALRADYPALCAFLGTAAFESLAAGYVAQHPSVYYNLDRYGHGFAAWVAGQHEDAFAHALARLEEAIAFVFMAEEAPPLSASALEGLSPDAFGALALRLRPASRLLALSYPASRWLERQRSAGDYLEPLPAPAAETEYLYIYRHHNEVQRMALEPPAYLLLKALSEGKNVGEALEAVVTGHPGYAQALAGGLGGWFAHWTGQGVFSAA